MFSLLAKWVKTRVFVPSALSCYSRARTLSYKCTAHVAFSGVSVCVLELSWMPLCQASVIQHKHVFWFKVNCHKKVLETSKKGHGKSLKSP